MYPFSPDCLFLTENGINLSQCNFPLNISH